MKGETMKFTELLALVFVLSIVGFFVYDRWIAGVV